MNTQPKPKGKIRRSSESGYTILEGLMAMVVVSVLMAAVSPMIVLATATRMQAKRIQLASQAANSYVAYMRSDHINSDEELSSEDIRKAKAPGNTVNSPDPDSGEVDPLTTYPAPDSGLNCADKDGDYCSEENKIFCVDFDDSGGCEISSQVDMVVQPIARLYNAPDPDDEPNQWALAGYNLAVRVYRANAFDPDLPPEQQPKNGSDEEGGIDQSTTSLIGRRDLPLINLQTSLEPTGDNAFQTYSDTLQVPAP